MTIPITPVLRRLAGTCAAAALLVLGSCADAPAPLESGPAVLALAPAGSQVQAFAGNAQVAVVNDTVPSLLVARVVSASGAPVKGVTVHWTITSGGGTLVVAGGYTNETGRAYARWKLGSIVGTQALRVDADGAGTAAFSARAIPANSRLQVVGGNGQAGAADSLLPQPLRVRLVEATGTPIPNAQVMWTVVAGGGSLGEGTASLADSAGVALNTWRLGNVPGEQRVRAAVRGLPPVELTAVAAVPGITLSIYAGNNQTGSQYDTLTQNLVVRVARADGTPVEGVTVSWATSGTYAGMKFPKTVTNSTGRAYNLWRPAKELGTRQATATVAGVGTVTFTATVVLNDRTLSVASGSGQTGYPGDTLPQPLVMRAVDGTGRGIRGVRVQWAADGGGTLDSASTYTDANGTARNRWRLSSRLQGQQVRAAITNSGQVTFTAAVTPVTGQQIVYRSNRSGGNGLFLVSPDGSHRYPIYSGVPSADPDWSPDGTQIVFANPVAGGIWLMNADGSDARRLTAGGQPAWSPAGDRIAFYAGGASGAGIYVVNVNGTGLTLLRSGAYEPAWSPDGSRIVFRNTAGGGGIMNADGSNPVSLAVGASPSWSPDGTRIASWGYNSDCACELGDVWMTPVDGSPAYIVGRGNDLDWAPDGNRLVVVSYDVYNKYHGLGVIRADGSRERGLDGGFNIYAPAWKPVP